MVSDNPISIISKDLIWKKFISNGELENRIILPQISDSWVRCSQIDLNPNDGKCLNVLEYSDVHMMLEKNQDIIDVAKPFMANIYEFFRNSGFIVVLSDENGYIMERFGDADVLTSAKHIHFVQGASWREEDVGTNAIAIGLKTGAPVQVSGAEHYCRKHHWWTCSAAPIYGYDGRIVALLDISGPAQAAYSHTLAMVAAAANAITMQIGIQQKNYELSLMNKRLSSIFNTMSDGVIFFDRLGKVREFNPIAQKILGKTGNILNGASVQTIFKGKNQLIQTLLNGKEAYADVEFFTDTEMGPSRCVISGETIFDKQGCINGGVIILRPMEKVHNLVNRFSGNYTTFKFSDIIGKSAQISEAIRQASLAAATSSNVILRGESGTGKEMFAQAIHCRSSRRNGPFIAVNCGAIPRELIGSELFGYEEGAFTGAKRGGRPGNFELASGGTLFLDEIGDMPLEQQVALLRVLQEKKVARLGGNKVIPIDVRVICATNKDLNRLAANGTFRQDLYYRLNVFTIEIPPLRDRRGDIEMLFRYFIEQIGSEQGCKYTVEAEVLECINCYDWPGNVRQVHNVVERACNLTEDQNISIACLPPEICCSPGRELPMKATHHENTGVCHYQEIKSEISDKECEEIKVLLAKERGNLSKVATTLGIARSTLYRKLKKYAIE
ncbi:Anaerobic nitric oxide reductase transcription regulator NorR [Sporomusa silvacetica DSM 10669]|uniref:Anaerobic nitric oxide reductase transcription regulator NorR n=1 Tax=Sporomusa silvacetica DSM 10669 TaxID=1123289 RepID=A0ABZ3IMG8_9FIRM|nr:sigma-54-dependent Fis family transcriptional regulator [Sporomusa silvacetica]OZC14421.1 limonene hydroxylase [Sporomusa silvacetica DSM 10669]